MKLCRAAQTVLRTTVALGGLAAGTAFAQQPNPPVNPSEHSDGSAPPYSLQYDGHLTIRADRTATEIATKRIKILTQAAVQTLSQQQAQYIEGMQKLETVEAYTEKADGKHVPVDLKTIIIRDAASGLQATYVPDLKQQTVIFPDVAVGDTLVITNKIEFSQTVFPGEFIDFDVFPRSIPFSSAQFIVEAPAALNVSIKATGSTATDKVETLDGVERHTITVAPQSYKPEEVGATSPLDRSPMLAVSTFHSYEELGVAYGKAALSKIKVTPEIAALADEITKDAPDHKTQAAAIDAWVKKNIRYVALFLSVGRVVPHEAEAILHNKFGDCKDKATLMAALLAAKGITSEAALINLGNAYSLPEPATLAALNHVILYLPEFDLYDDPTMTWGAFGVLAAQAYDKPVVRISEAGAKLSHTPAMKPEDHVAHATTTIKFSSGGTVSGQTQESNSGIMGVALRSIAGVVQQVGDETIAQRQLQAFNTPGTGHIDLGTASETLDPAVISSSYTFSNPFKAPAPGAYAIVPIGMPLSARPGNSLLGSRLNGRTSEFTCFAGTQIEDIEAAFDPGLPLPIPLVPVTIDNPVFTYKSSFRVENRTLKVHRELVSRVPHQVCPAETEVQISADLEKVRIDINSGYKFASLNAAAPALGGVPKPVEVNLAVTAGQKRRLDFAYSIDLDCSSKGYATVTTVEVPQHGKITVDHGPGKSTFPASNPRSECNKGEVQGTILWYEPVEGFTGTDSVTVDLTYADGGTAKRRYALNVAPPGAAKPDVPAPILEVKRVAVADQPLRVDFFYELNPDCSVVGIPTIRILEEPKNGKAAVEKGSGFSSFPTSNTRSKCNENRSDGAVISYVPNPGYTGMDSIATETIFLNGTSRKRTYAIEVK